MKIQEKLDYSLLTLNTISSELTKVKEDSAAIAKIKEKVRVGLLVLDDMLDRPTGKGQ